MPNTTAAKKRMKQNEAQRLRNKSRRSAVKTQVKRFLDAVQSGDAEKAGDELRKTSRMLDRTASTSTMHKNTAARKKSRLSARLNAMSKSAG